MLCDATVFEIEPFPLENQRNPASDPDVAALRKAILAIHPNRASDIGTSSDPQSGKPPLGASSRSG
jgi:hypothetical protein